MREISFFTENITLPVFFTEERILKWFDQIAEKYEVELGELSFIFCTDDYLLEINRQYLEHDYYTDVITFDYSEDRLISGDIFISLDTVLSNSQLYQTDFKEEFYRVVCHSLLHLIGFKDKTENEQTEMRCQENSCLELLKTTKNEEPIA